MGHVPSEHDREENSRDRVEGIRHGRPAEPVLRVTIIFTSFR
jgi:hypothetical protein